MSIGTFANCLPLCSRGYVTFLEKELEPVICDQLPDTYTKVQPPPPIDDVSALLWNEFDKDNLGYEDQDADLGTDFEDDDLFDVDGYDVPATKAPPKTKSCV